MRPVATLAILALALANSIFAPTAVLARDRAVFYGPKSGPFGEGYKHKTLNDGSWRIVTEYNANDPDVALNVALYRAAELAREGGHAYVQILGGYGMARLNVASGFVYARPADTPAMPDKCREKGCYTAAVAQLIELLSGRVNLKSPLSDPRP